MHRTTTDLGKTQNAIENFLEHEPLGIYGIKNHKLTFYKMFYQPLVSKGSTEESGSPVEVSSVEHQLEPTDQLQVNFDTTYGGVEKDYNKYLKSTLFNYSLGEVGYEHLLQVVAVDFRRRYFKKLISHMARFSTDISEKNLKLIADICYEQKAGLTLIEIAYLFMNNGIINRPGQLIAIIEKLRFFKDLADNAETMSKFFATKAGLPYSTNYIKPHLDLLMKHGKYDRFMPIFDRVRLQLPGSFVNSE